MRLLFFIIAVSSPVLFCGNRIEVLNTTAGKIQVYGFTFASKNCKQKVVSSSQTIERGERQTFYSKFVSKNEDCRFSGVKFKDHTYPVDPKFNYSKFMVSQDGKTLELVEQK